MLVVVLCDKKDVVIRDVVVDVFLGKFKDDLIEFFYCYVIFNFLRVVFDRCVEIVIVYDIMDYVGIVMIINDDKDIWDFVCGVFF